MSTRTVTALAAGADANLEAIARSTDLHALEEIVRKGKSTFLEVGTALWRIKEAKLYKATHSSWESWCETHWHATKRHADRQIAAARMAQELGPRGPSLADERHARELGGVPADQRAEVLNSAGAASSRELRGVVMASVTPAPAGQLGFGMPGSPRRDLSQWDTRPETAKWLVEWAGVHGAKPAPRILEPSAGKGNIVRALLAAGARVEAVEVDPRRAASLDEESIGCCRNADFLDFAAGLGPGDHYHAAVMNPPYENGQDLAHILGALSLAPRVIVLARLALLEGQERRRELWDKHRLARLCVLSERESFEGDVDGTPKSAFAAFDIRRGPGKSVVEWR